MDGTPISEKFRLDDEVVSAGFEKRGIVFDK